MALRLRMQRFGNTHRPRFHVVVTDSRNARNGKFIEKLGYYNPQTEPSEINLNLERMEHWYKMGACPSDAVHALLKAKKLVLNSRKS